MAHYLGNTLQRSCPVLPAARGLESYMMSLASLRGLAERTRSFRGIFATGGSRKMSQGGISAQAGGLLRTSHHVHTVVPDLKIPLHAPSHPSTSCLSHHPLALYHCSLYHCSSFAHHVCSWCCPCDLPAPCCCHSVTLCASSAAHITIQDVSGPLTSAHVRLCLPSTSVHIRPSLDSLSFRSSDFLRSFRLSPSYRPITLFFVRLTEPSPQLPACILHVDSSSPRSSLACTTPRLNS